MIEDIKEKINKELSKKIIELLDKKDITHHHQYKFLGISAAMLCEIKRGSICNVPCCVSISTLERCLEKLGFQADVEINVNYSKLKDNNE